MSKNGKVRFFLRIPNATGNIYEVETSPNYFTAENLVLYERTQSFGLVRSGTQLSLLNRLDLGKVKKEWRERMEYLEDNLLVAGNTSHEITIAQKGKKQFIDPLLRLTEVLTHLESSDTYSAVKVISEIGYDLMGGIQQAMQDAVEKEAFQARFEVVADNHETLTEDLPKWGLAINRVVELSKEFQEWAGIFKNTQKQAEEYYSRACACLDPTHNKDVKYAFEFFDGNDSLMSFIVRADDAISEQNFNVMQQLHEEAVYYRNFLKECEGKGQQLWDHKRGDFRKEVEDIEREFDRVWAEYEGLIFQIQGYINLYRREDIPVNNEKTGVECSKQTFEIAMGLVRKASTLTDEKRLMNSLAFKVISFLTNDVTIPHDIKTCLQESEGYISRLTERTPIKPLTTPSLPSLVMESEAPRISAATQFNPTTPSIKITIPKEERTQRAEQLYEIVLCIAYVLTGNQNLKKHSSMGSLLANVPYLGLCTEEEVKSFSPTLAAKARSDMIEVSVTDNKVKHQTWSNSSKVWLRFNTNRTNERGDAIYKYKLTRKGGAGIEQRMSQYGLTAEMINDARERRRITQEEKKRQKEG